METIKYKVLYLQYGKWRETKRAFNIVTNGLKSRAGADSDHPKFPPFSHILCRIQCNMNFVKQKSFGIFDTNLKRNPYAHIVYIIFVF